MLRACALHPGDAVGVVTAVLQGAVEGGEPCGLHALAQVEGASGRGRGARGGGWGLGVVWGGAVDEEGDMTA